MKLDNNWQIPEGFTAVLDYRKTQKGETVVGEISLAATPGGQRLIFWVGEDKKIVPALPLRTCGRIRHMGWDIPTRYVIDAAGRAWVDNAHGHPLRLVEPEVLISVVESENDRRHIQRMLGLPVDPPEWVKQARAHGWSPPEGWTDE